MSDINDKDQERCICGSLVCICEEGRGDEEAWCAHCRDCALFGVMDYDHATKEDAADWWNAKMKNLHAEQKTN